MTPRSAITIILAASLTLLGFSALVFNREMAASAVFAGRANGFSERLEASGFNAKVDAARASWKAALGMTDG